MFTKISGSPLVYERVGGEVPCRVPCGGVDCDVRACMCVRVRARACACVCVCECE